MDLVGNYLRLRRELLESASHGAEQAPHLHRLAVELELAGESIESDHPDAAPFLDTNSWLAPMQALARRSAVPAEIRRLSAS